MTMSTQQLIQDYLNSLTDAKKSDLTTIHDLVLSLHPHIELSFDSGKNSENITVSNPSIGYGTYMHRYANGDIKPMYALGISANTSGISIYCLNLKDRNILKDQFGPSIGKAKITGYCINFKTLNDLNFETLKDVINFSLQH